MSPELSQLATELLSSLPWSVVLPAGCGKTELIAAIAASIPQGQKPILVLTHTNAGVDVLRKRFRKYGVEKNKARVFTLDSWAAHFSEHFPLLGAAAYIPDEADIWLSAKLKAKEIFKSPHVGHIIAATYSAILVDEYQDCSDLQHELVVSMSQHLPVGILGDPLQGIFDFGEGVVDWSQVEGLFPPKILEPVPHRWLDSSPELGQWLLTIRPQLVAGASLDLSETGVPVVWVKSDWQEERRYCTYAADHITAGKQIVVLRQQPAQCHTFARNLFNKFSVAEELELKVATKLVTAIDQADGAKVASEVIKFVRSCCVGSPTSLSKELISNYSQGNMKTYRKGNTNSEIFDKLNILLTEPTIDHVKDALKTIKSKSNRVYRHEAWFKTMKILDEASHSDKSILESLQKSRNKQRYTGQASVRHCVSRTLLVKGQECDECIIIGADGMSARNLYVALSRGVDKVTVFSDTPVLTITTF